MSSAKRSKQSHPNSKSDTYNVHKCIKRSIQNTILFMILFVDGIMQYNIKQSCITTKLLPTAAVK